MLALTRILIKTLRWFAVAVGAVVVIALVLNPRPQAPPASPGNCVSMAVASNGWHTNLYLPAEAFAADSDLRRRWPWARWFVVGWGDESFYREGPTVSGAFAAAIPPSPTVLHIVALEDRPDSYFLDDWEFVAVSREGLGVITSDIEAELSRDGNGGAVMLSEGYYSGRSGFFRAESSYHLLKSCNQWTADRLRRAGLPINSPVSSFAQPVMWQIRFRAPKQCP